MSKQIKTYLFSNEHLEYFQKEMDETGGFENLMLHKEAMTSNDGESVVIINPDRDGYKKKHLIGIYKSLHEYYDTEAPYLFWVRMYQMLQNKI